MAALQVTLTEGEQDRLGRVSTTNLEAYDYYLRGREIQAHMTHETNAQARHLFERAIALDPRFAAAHAYRGWTYFEQWALGWGLNPQTLEHAFTTAQRAIALDRALPDGHRLLGVVYLWRRQYEQAIAAAERAIALAPNGADAYVALAEILSWAGKSPDSVHLIEQAMRLNPQYPAWYVWDLGHAYFLTGQYDQAIVTLKRMVIRNPDFMPAHAYLCTIYTELGRTEEAQAEAMEFVRLSPHVSFEELRHRVPYKDPSVLERVLVAVRTAGLQ